MNTLTDHWKIVGLTIDNTTAYVSLEAVDSVASVMEFAKSQNKRPRYYLKPYQIVEVDFGYQSDLFYNDGSKDKNRKSSFALLPGEMHKRRPCIVLEAKNKRVQVIPLSAAEENDYDDPLIVPISEGSYRKLAPRYTRRPSCAVVGMIQTVSAYRVFPPMNENFLHEHHYHLYKVTKGDRDALKLALAQQYSKDITFQLRTLTDQFTKLQHEKKKLFASHTDMSNTKKSLEARCSELEAFLLKFGEDLGAGGSLEDIMAYYDD